MRSTLSVQTARCCISLFIQSALVISLTVLPLNNPATIRGAQQPVLPAGEATTSLQDEAADDDGPTALRNEKSSSRSKRGERDNGGADQELAGKIGFAGVPSLAESVMGFANAKTANELDKLLADKAAVVAGDAQDPRRPIVTPPTPGLGSGGTGPMDLELNEHGRQPSIISELLQHA